jgi:hypothetical protein
MADEKLTENHVWHIAIIDFVDLHGDTLAIVPDFDGVALRIDGDLYHVLSLIILVVICRIYQNLIY